MTTLVLPATPPAPEVPARAAVPSLPEPVCASLGAVVERLYREYECCLPLSQVLDVVIGCVCDIQATPASALPELAERLARFRLARIGHQP
ncbi:hypothetical protein [Jatrophihabitans sp.]|uniref:hypothetical protein n=1 Tax=Jatrophihabitans sp. TaxID=1932789 RepID=UPI002B7E197C|nr:hypothetical protein [Jatrophihabitans sp.]